MGLTIVSGFFDDYAWQILLAELLFTVHLPHRHGKFFWLEIIGAAIIGVGLSFGSFQLGLYDCPFYAISAFFIFEWILSCAVVYFTCSIDLKSSIFIAIAGYCVQNVYFNVKKLFLDSFSVETFSFLYWIILLLTLIIIYGGAYFLFAHKKRVQQTSSIATWKLILLGTVVIVIACVLSTYSSSLSVNYPVAYIGIGACCILTLFIMFGLFDQSELKKENEVLNSILYRKEQDYRITQDTIDLINIKCHDIKKQISGLRYLETNEKSDYIKEIENSVMIYESIAKTDNRALDLVLTEKSLLCEKYNIQFSYIADGKLLDFMSPADVYSLFGNAIDNAIEALLKVKDEEKRMIQMNIRAKGKLVYVDIDNYSEEKTEFKNGMPVTSKADDKYHGFGVKSIRHITEKYGGAFSVSQDNNTFMLHLLFTLPQDNAM